MPGIARYTPTLSGVFGIRLVTCDTALFPHVGDAIATLLEDYGWYEDGDTVDNTITASWQAFQSFYSDMLIGCVSLFLGGVPDGWLPLDGSTYDGGDYPLLYDVLPAALKSGGDFTLPDMSDVFPYGTNTPSDAGSEDGSNSLTLTTAQLPAHSHTYTPPTLNIDLEVPGAPDLLAAGIGTPTQTEETGSGDSIDIRPARVSFVFAVFTGQYVTA